VPTIRPGLRHTASSTSSSPSSPPRSSSHPPKSPRYTSNAGPLVLPLRASN
jgi:hypothetical protein